MIILFTLAFTALGHIIIFYYAHSHMNIHTHTHWSGLSGAQIFGIAFSSIIIVCCGPCCLCILIAGYICHKKGKTLRRSYHSPLPQAPQSHALNSHPYTAQELTNTSQTYPSSIAKLQQTDTEPSAPPLEAVTHAGEAPPPYHAVVHYKTVRPETKDVRLSSACTLTESRSDAPPVYKETQDWKQ